MVIVGSAQAQIAEWTFDSLALSASDTNSTSLFNVFADVGSGTASSTHAGTTVFSIPVGNGSAESVSATKWSVNDYWQFQASTLGSSGIEVSWDQTGSSTGPRWPVTWLLWLWATGAPALVVRRWSCRCSLR